MSIYVIAGATGHVGSVAARTLLEKGHKVRAIVRDAKKGEALAAAGAELAIGEIEDASFLARALGGAAGAFLLVPPNMAAPDVRAAQQVVVASIDEAVRASGVPHVVLLSSWGADLPAGTGPIVGLHLAENALRAAGTTLTALRAGMFMENLLGMVGAAQHQGILPNFQREDLALPLIATVDIAGAVVEALLHPPQASEVVYVLGGTEYKPADMAAVLGQLLGKHVQLVTIPVEGIVGALAQAGLPASISALYQEMYATLNAGRLAIEPGHRVHTGTTTLDAALKPYLAA